MTLKKTLWSEKKLPRPNKDVLTQIAGLTGLGWTISVLGFLSTVAGYGTSLVTRLVTEPHALLYLGAVFFLATIGLDRLANRLSERDRAQRPE